MQSNTGFFKKTAIAKIGLCLLAILQFMLIASTLFGLHSSVHHRLLNVPLICQLPELEYGCELTSLTMLLQHYGTCVSKLDVANNAPRDITPILAHSPAEIYEWGNPAVGYVGDISGEHLGYSIDPQPISEFISREYNIKAINLTGASVNELKDILYAGHPIMAWVTYDFTTDSRPRYWLDANNHLIKADFNMHCVVLTGYDDYNFYYNDPLRNKKNLPINQDIFTCGWVIHGKKALCLV